MPDQSLRHNKPSAPPHPIMKTRNSFLYLVGIKYEGAKLPPWLKKTKLENIF